MNFPGLPGAGPSASGAPSSAPGQFNPQDPEVQKYAAMMSGAMESCYTKTVMSGVMGFGLGGLFGMFMASVSLSSSTSLPILVPSSVAREREELSLFARVMG
jgi:mitochondrial import inner membrane translocase subunit TIM22